MWVNIIRGRELNKQEVFWTFNTSCGKWWGSYNAIAMGYGLEEIIPQNHSQKEKQLSALLPLRLSTPPSTYCDVLWSVIIGGFLDNSIYWPLNTNNYNTSVLNLLLRFLVTASNNVYSSAPGPIPLWTAVPFQLLLLQTPVQNWPGCPQLSSRHGPSSKHRFQQYLDRCIGIYFRGTFYWAVA
jgi:hypothetical protein